MTSVSFTASWSVLPNELKAEVVSHLDLASALALMRCDGDEKAVVREFGFFNVGINLVQVLWRPMVIQLRSYPENAVVQSWVVRDEKPNRNELVVQHFDVSETLINRKVHEGAMPEMAFSIVSRLTSESIFKVQQLEFALNYYNREIPLNLKKIVDVKYLAITNCPRNTTRSLLENQKIKTDSFVVTCNNMTKLECAKQKLIKTCIERELKDIVVVRQNLNTVVVCPSNKSDFFRENHTHNH